MLLAGALRFREHCCWPVRDNFYDVIGLTGLKKMLFRLNPSYVYISCVRSNTLLDILPSNFEGKTCVTHSKGNLPSKFEKNVGKIKIERKIFSHSVNGNV